MKQINLITYEAFALDYLEGTLSAELQEEMEIFLKQHPAIAQEIEEMRDFYPLEKEPVVFPYKSILLKTEAESPFIIPFYLKIAASAAILLLVVSVYFLSSQKEFEQTNTYATKEKIERPSINSKPNPSSKDIQQKEEQLSVPVKSQPLPNHQSQKKRPAKPTKKNIHSVPVVEFAPTKKAYMLPLAHQQKAANLPKTTIKVIQNLPKNKLDKSFESQQTIAVATLPKLSPKVIPHSNHTIDLPTEQLYEKALSDAVASTSSQKKSLKGMLGKLSLKVGKSAFIPTFYTEDGGGQ